MPEGDPISVQVTQPITKGSIVVVKEYSVEDDEVTAVMHALKGAAGHDRFVLLIVPDGASVGIFGPDDLVEALKRLGKDLYGDEFKKSVMEGTT